MSEQQSSYRNIMKATSLFGGVQVFKILIAIIRSKVIAILLGPVGMGIEGLFNASTGLISSASNFGLGISAVRDIAEANESQNPSKIARTIAVLRKLVWFTGIFGALLTLILSSYLSQISFGKENYRYALSGYSTI